MFLFPAVLLAACAATSPLPEVPAPSPADDTRGWEFIGTSVEGREIEAGTFGRGRIPVYLVGGIHGDEMEGGVVLDRVLDELAAASLEGVTLRVVRNLNPDGAEAGIRGNARGVDLNRNWPAPNFEASRVHGSGPLSEPETAAVNDDMRAFSPDLVLVLHSARAGPFVNFDGPAEELAALFANGAARADSRWRVVADVGYPTPGSLGSLVGRGQGKPILTIEFRRGQDSTSAYPAFYAGMQALLAGLPAALPATQHPPPAR